MSQMIPSTQLTILKECVARRILAEPGFNSLTNGDSDSDADSDSLDDFTSYLAEEMWSDLPSSLHAATYEGRVQVPDIDELPLERMISPAISDTLVSCGLADSRDPDAPVQFLRKVLRTYVEEACAPPPVWSKTRTIECEICEREVPLTYHHLIPREVHEKALKKKWHPEAMLNSVAWLCRPCHSVVHQVSSNEVLAKEFYSVDLLLAREDIQKWRKYAARQRFGVRR